MSTSPGSSRWSLVIPVKTAQAAKTRLLLAAPWRTRVARAMALDTVRAALECPVVAGVLVVTDDDAQPFRELGAVVTPDRPRAGLNAALAFGAAFSGSQSVGVAAVLADLPALRPQELADALAVVPVDGRAVVADAAGGGTTLLAASAGRALGPRFGPGSHRRHLASGAVDLTLAAGPGLRRDVDTIEDLRLAAALGLGRHTAALLADVEREGRGAPPDQLPAVQ